MSILKKITILLLIAFASASVDVAGAIQVGKYIEYAGGNMGKVIFNGKAHNDEGYHCMKCHNDYFIPKVGAAKIAYSDHSTRKEYCFGCHNGTKAFDALSNCNLCHKNLR
jgi:c(7)-type cytochrome triheme protein